MLVPPSSFRGFYRLAVAHQGGKALAEAVDGFADAEVEALKHVVALGLTILHVAVVFSWLPVIRRPSRRKSSAQNSPLVTRTLRLPLFSSANPAVFSISTWTSFCTFSG